MTKHRDDIPIITSARPTFSSEALNRKKKYLRLMSLRIPTLLLAVIIFETTHKTWLALLIIIISIPIPWIAVLIANDRPPQQKLSFFKLIGLSHKKPVQPIYSTPTTPKLIIIENNNDVHT